MVIIRVNGTVKQCIHYQWDSDGKPLGFNIREQNASGEWVSTSYYFWTNQRGDVISILDSSGNEVGSYLYDAYGNVLSENGTIAKENPIRYAGYYYDGETKHYYLKARYYDPENGNFLALDPHPGNDDDPLSQNGYTYAKNNPVMNVDPSGKFTINITLSVKTVARAINLALLLFPAGVAIKEYFAVRRLDLLGRVYIRENIDKAIKRAKINVAKSTLGLIVNSLFEIYDTNIGKIIATVLDRLDGKKDGKIKIKKKLF